MSKSKSLALASACVAFLFLFTGCLESLVNETIDELNNSIEETISKASEYNDWDIYYQFCKWEYDKCEDSLNHGYKDFDECYETNRAKFFDLPQNQCRDFHTSYIEASVKLPCNLTCTEDDFGTADNVEDCEKNLEIVINNKDLFENDSHCQKEEKE